MRASDKQFLLCHTDAVQTQKGKYTKVRQFGLPTSYNLPLINPHCRLGEAQCNPISQPYIPIHKPRFNVWIIESKRSSGALGCALLRPTYELSRVLGIL